MSHVIAVRLSDAEHECFVAACQKYHVTRQQFLRAMVIDALVDEGYDGLRRREPEGCEGLGEAGQAGGTTTP